jgi:hypothetical protein
LLATLIQGKSALWRVDGFFIGGYLPGKEKNPFSVPLCLRGEKSILDKTDPKFLLGL